MNVQSFRLFTLPNDIIDFTFYNLVVGFAADFFQFQTSAMITRHDFIVNKPPEIIKEKKIYFIRSLTKVTLRITKNFFGNTITYKSRLTPKKWHKKPRCYI